MNKKSMDWNNQSGASLVEDTLNALRKAREVAERRILRLKRLLKEALSSQNGEPMEWKSPDKPTVDGETRASLREAINKAVDDVLWEETSKKEDEFIAPFVSFISPEESRRIDKLVEADQPTWRDWCPAYNRASVIPRGEVEVRLRDGRILRGKSYDFKWGRANQRQDPFWEIVAWRPCA